MEDGLADTTTWGELAARNKDTRIPAGVSENSPFVQILDPATGTGTFLETVIEVVYDTMTRKWRRDGKHEGEIKAAWNEYVPDHLLPRLYGFELMMAPYAVAHLKLGLKLKETGYKFESPARLQVYLTNTLEEPKDFSGQLFADFLAHEAQEANRVKRSTPITVVIANPPYTARSYNLTEYARALVEPYKFIDGVKIEEKGALQLEKNLNDDYVKFVRYAQITLDRQGTGLMGMITNNSFLENPTLRGMRWSLLGAFDTLSVVDLHGNAARKERSSDGSRDENVFDITQGVSISVFSKGLQPVRNPSIYRLDLLGSRERKYAWLLDNDIHSKALAIARPCPPYYLFRVEDASIRMEYEEAVSIVSLFPLNSTGVKTHRDAFCIDFELEPLVARIEDLRNPDISDEAIRQRYNLHDTYGWRLSRCRQRLQSREDWSKSFHRILYRPMDIRWIYFHPDVVELPRLEVMGHLLRGSNLGLVFMRQVASDEFYSHFGISRYPVDNRAFYSNRGTMSLAPLYRYEGQDLFSGTSYSRYPNIDSDLAASVARRLGMCIDDHQPPSDVPFSPEGLVQYIYAVFHSQGYRSRFSEFLKIDFPRVPLTTESKLFRALMLFGKDLIGLHLMDNHVPMITSFGGTGANTVEKIRHTGPVLGSPVGRVWINETRFFEGVSPEIWAFQIGGYQVCEKWLKDRRGRKLSDEDILHYQRVVAAIQETIRIMGEIDEVIDAHGGWPGAFQGAGD